MPRAARHGLRPLYGDIHNHCNISYGHGSLAGALENARRQLDFVSITGHAYWPDMPVDDPRVARIVDFHVKGFARLAELWPGHFETLARYHRPGEFTVFPGYEMHSAAHGDYTIVLRDLDQREMIKADSPRGLLAALRAAYGERAFAFPHHIGYRLGARGLNWQSFSEELSPVLELISMHGCAETSLTDRPFLHSMGPCDGANTVHAGLNAGRLFGVIGNTDHHSGFPGSYGHGRGAVYAADNNAEAVWSAIHARCTNALTGDNAHLFLTVGGAVQGGIVAPGSARTVAIEAVGGSFIDCIDVIRNGRLVHRVTPAISPSPIDTPERGFETILALELGWGSRGSFHDWQGWLAVRGGEILGVEPRLRGPEIVSPLEGGEHAEHTTVVAHEGDRVRFAVRSYANPNNATSATQGLALRLRLEQGARIEAEFDGQPLEVASDRLLAGALSGNLGPIDSPAYRLHPLPRPHEWQWQGELPLEPLASGDWLTLRMRQSNGQWAWTSPIFCR